MSDSISLLAQLEAVLFLSPKPMSAKALARIVDASVQDVVRALDAYAQEKNTETSGVHLLLHGNEYQFVTNPACADVLRAMARDDAGELTRPSLETLTVIAYRGPLSRPELEAIRGVQCALILRNLLVRGLIDEKEDSTRGESVYTLSADALRYLGVHSEKELPDYEAFHQDTRISHLVDALNNV